MIFTLLHLCGLAALVWAGADDGPGDAEFKSESIFVKCPVM